MSVRFIVTCLALLSQLASAAATAGLPAFPGAEGAGALALGGRGGLVCKVSNLKDSGPGSFRECIDMNGPRTVVFQVGGTINLDSRIVIVNPYLTIAGQTAPGGGIQIKASDRWDDGTGDLITVATHNVVIRYLRIRKGYTGHKSGNLRVTGSNVIADHVSLFWSENQNWTVYTWGSSGPQNVTLQNSIVGEMLDGRVNLLVGASNGAGALSMTNVDHHNNLIANSKHRNPLGQHASGRWVNNIIYNWSFWASRSVGGVHHDWIANLWKRGPAPKDSTGIQELQFVRYSEEHNNPERLINRTPSLYVEGNRGLQSGMSPDADNWSFTREAGPFDNGSVIGPTPPEWRRTRPLPPAGVPIIVRHVDELEKHLLPIVGASERLDCTGKWVPNRDAADARLITEYVNNKGRLTSSGEGEAVYGGHPLLAAGVPCKDSSGDGIPDEWAVANGLDPADPSLGIKVHESGYTYLEMYLNGSQMGKATPGIPQNISVK